MLSLERYLDDRLAHGRSYFSREEALKALGVASRNFAAAATRLINKGRLANPRHGFFLILRPEDKVIGAPDPVRWIDPLMKHQQLGYPLARSHRLETRVVSPRVSRSRFSFSFF